MNTTKEEWIKEGQTFDHEVEYWDKHILYHERGFRTEYIRQFPSIYMEKYNPNGTVYYDQHRDVKFTRKDLDEIVWKLYDMLDEKMSIAVLNADGRTYYPTDNFSPKRD